MFVVIVTLFFRLKVHYTVADDSGTASVVFWDKLATQIFGKTASEMKQILLSVSSYMIIK